MGEMQVTLSSGMTLGFTQMVRLATRLDELGAGSHWHKNECGCCVTVHGHDCAYIIGPDGGETFYPERGCECE
jgi:hypothetical protein